MKTVLLERNQISQAALILKKKGIVAFPTDTVYGLACLFDDKEAIEKMKEAKNRPEEKSFPLMVASFSKMAEVAYIPEEYEELIKHFMPGAFTVILKKKDIIPDYSTGYKDTVAIRIPDDEFVISLLQECGPLLVTSANISGKETGKNNEEVLEQLEGRIEAVVKGKALGKASTIVDLTGEDIKILRTGEITEEEINDWRKENAG